MHVKEIGLVLYFLSNYILKIFNFKLHLIGPGNIVFEYNFLHNLFLLEFQKDIVLYFLLLTNYNIFLMMNF